MLMLDGMPAVRVKTELLESEQGVSRGFYIRGFIFQQAGDPCQATLWLAGPLLYCPFLCYHFGAHFRGRCGNLILPTGNTKLWETYWNYLI